MGLRLPRGGCERCVVSTVGQPVWLGAQLRWHAGAHVFTWVKDVFACV